MSLMSQSTFPSLISEPIKRDRTLMVFDLEVLGHHASYIRHLIKYWCEQHQSGQLNVIVLPQFIDQHSEVVNLPSQYKANNIRFIAISAEEAAKLRGRDSGKERILRNFQEWRLLCKYARLLSADHCLIMFLDTCELPLTLGLRPPCPISGIYFRPTFHYQSFPDQTFSRRDRLQQWRERVFLYRTLRNPQLHKLLCIDPFVSDHINTQFKTNKAIHLADPVELPTVTQSQVDDLKKRLQIQPDRHVFLLFGLLEGRKGIYKVLEALQAMSPERCEQICLLLVGRVRPTDHDQVESQLQALRQSQPIQIVTQFEFVPEQAVHAYFHLADVVLAPYQRHVGMSGILLLAAAAQKPVISSNYGLMGELVRQYELGLAVDSVAVEEIARGIIQFLTASPSQRCNVSKMKLFTDDNLDTKFSEVIFQALRSS